MLDKDITELGTDFNSLWEFKDGDLVLIDNDTNLVQSIVSRLNCEYDSLDDYYYEYGTDLSSFLGFKSSNETLEFIKIEVTETLQQDPRINSFEVATEYDKDKNVIIHIHIFFDEDSDLSVSLVLNEEGNVALLNEVVNIGE